MAKVLAIVSVSAHANHSYVGPSKPRLVARSNEPKSPWSYHKVPKISAAEAPKNSKELLSCALWRLHEYGNNPIAPETFALLTNKPEVKAAAEKLNVPTTTTTSVRGKLADIAMKDDRRETEGLVHIEFPVPSTGNSVAHDGNKDQEATDDSDNLVINGDKILSAEDVLDDEELEELNEALAANVSTTKPEIASILSTVDHAILDAPTHPEEESKPLSLNGISPQQQSNEATLNDEGAQQDDVKKQDKLAEATTARAISKSPNRSATPSSRIEAEAMANGAPDDESELDSDEEIIVFNPKARLASAAAKRSDTQRSRPSTANGSVSLKPTEPRSQVSVPVTGEQPSPPGSSTLKPKSPVGSALKAQSPVFTPGQLYVPSQSPVAAKASPPVLQQQPNGNRRKSPPRVTQDRPTSTSRQPRAPVLPRPQSQDQNAEVRRQTEIIQRQRQAIQRQAQAAAKPPPRQVRMEPTENPTIIDPDAFDRSYVVQPVSNPPNTSTASKRRSGGGGRRRSPRNSPPNASPKRPVSRAEPDVDFVLKSGAPRGSMRGKGKLWVP